MLAGLLFVAFFAIALAGVPLLFALLATTIGAVAIAGLGHPLESIFLSFIGGVEPYILIAVPLFIFAGEILASGGVGRRIVEFARALREVAHELEGVDRRDDQKDGDCDAEKDGARDVGDLKQLLDPLRGDGEPGQTHHDCEERNGKVGEAPGQRDRRRSGRR